MTTPTNLNASASDAPPAPGAPLLPPNSFDFLPDIHALIQRVFNDELDPKNVVHEAALIRLKIQKARSLVAQLPEVDKTVEELQAEIEMLQDRINKQREMLKEVASMDVVQEASQKMAGQQ